MVDAISSGLAAINDAILLDLLPAVATLVALTVTTFAVKVARAALAKFGVEADARLDAKVQFVVEKYVRAAEELVESKFKSGVIPYEEKAIQKAEIALTGILDELPFLNEDAAKVLVHAALSRVGLGAAAGAITVLAEKVQAATPAPPPAQ
jgi:hypothetical protein